MKTLLFGNRLNKSARLRLANILLNELALRLDLRFTLRPLLRRDDLVVFDLADRLCLVDADLVLDLSTGRSCHIFAPHFNLLHGALRCLRKTPFCLDSSAN